MRRNSILLKIVKMTNLWYEYVSMDHHKDCDCHWYIQQDFAYGCKPTWSVYHFGYLYESKEVLAESYLDALKKILVLIKKAFSKELSWALGISKDYSKWDEYQVEKAKFAIKNFKNN